jgi:signal transduction histidine kinase
MLSPNPIASLKKIVRFVEWAILLTDLLAGLLSTYFGSKPQLLSLFCLYSAVFFLLSCIFPTDRPLWQRRAYIAIEIVLLLSALALQLWFDIFPYLVLAKSCLLLRRHDVILAAVVLGVGRITLTAWSLPERIAEVVAQIQRGEIDQVFNAQSIVLVSIVSYLGASLFAICFGFVLVAEHQSRQRAEVLAQQVEAQAATLERTRIAREIHDSLGHSLTTLDVQLELAQRLFERDLTQASNALAIAHQLSSQCLQDVRCSIQTMREHDFDLNQSLRILADQVQQIHPLQIQLELHLPKLPMQVSHQLYCIVQEGLTNIQKHAQATVVYLYAGGTAAGILLEVRDDGIGFESEHCLTGFGLRGMQERAQLLNGQVTICSAEGRGTYIKVTIPYDSFTFSG